MAPELTKQQQQALDDHQGFIRGSSYVLMSIDVFRRTVGIDDEAEERTATLEAVDEAMGQLQAGQGIPLDEFKRRLNKKHGLPN